MGKLSMCSINDEETRSERPDARHGKPHPTVRKSALQHFPKEKNNMLITVNNLPHVAELMMPRR
jgi:hypothetical protein